jgi:hypothetical protein
MTQHEFLTFVAGLHEHVEQSLSNPGPWCWPTRELLLDNLNSNRQHFSDSPRPMSAHLAHMLRTLRAKGWVVADGCTEHCHASHVRITLDGLEALRLMDELGCGEVLRQGAPKHCEHVPHAQFRFHRKLAA